MAKNNEETEKLEEETFTEAMAHISSPLNSTTGHEPHDWGMNREMVIREFGVHLISLLCEITDEKNEKKIGTTVKLDVTKMKKYIKDLGELEGESNES